MVEICQHCGDRGLIEALNYCKRCQTYPIHRYCLDVLPKALDEYCTWFCEDCEAIMVPMVKSEVKLKKKKRVRRSKKKKKHKVKTKGNDDKGPSSSPLQLPEEHCSEKKNDTIPEGPGDPVREGGANHGEVATSSNTSNFFGHNCYVAQPIVDPVWGCEIWPKGFEKWGPTDQSIALYFFSEGESSQKAFDLLVNAMMGKDLAMKAVLENAELLVFTSSMLPMRYWRFQTKYYLWGVFRGKQAAQPRNNVASEERTFAESLPCMQSPISPLSNTSILHSRSLRSCSPLS